MTPEDYAAAFRVDMDALDLLSERAEQDDRGEIGASSYECRERMRRVMVRAPRTDSPPMMAALIGNYVDAGVKRARLAANPKLLIDTELPVLLPNGYKHLVHPDEIDQDEPSVTDYKTKAGLAAIRIGFVEDRARIQRHLQYYAALQAGLVPEGGIVRNVFIDRSGKDDALHVEQELFDLSVIDRASEFVDDVLYAVKHGETARQDTPRYKCRVSCPWFTACRGSEVQAETTTDEELSELIASYASARRTEAHAKQLASELREMGLEGLTVKTRTHVLTSTWINAVKTRPYWKITVEDL